mmetsp:Transcript_15346/g.42073  ORF Transcript_15346/g.42073 Transcript_15346/m.42073 type:complete len:237 (-) Transcript_15346:179-889(-)
MTEVDEFVFHARGERLTATREILTKVPFLEALMADRVHTIKNDTGEPVIDRDPLLVKAVLEFVSSGHSLYSLTKLPKASSAQAMLVELDFFCVEPPAVRPLDDASFKRQLKDVKDEYGRECKRGPIEKVYSANRFGARNAAAELAVGLQNEKYDISIQKTRQQLYNNILFIMSHSATFGPRVRHHVWDLARTKVRFTQKQTEELERWVGVCDEEESDTSDASISTDSCDFSGYCSS